jgi:hypothetical protein
MSLIGMTEAQREAYFAAGQPNPVWGNAPDGSGLVQIGVYYGTPGTFRDDSPNYVPFHPAILVPFGPTDPDTPGPGFSAWQERQQAQTREYVSHSDTRRQRIEAENARLRAEGAVIERKITLLNMIFRER